jgi:peptide/nickel transport system substrate-binding protein
VVSEFVGSHTYQWYLNILFPPFDNEKFRKAFSLALDRRGQISTFFLGHEPLGRGLLTPSSWAWSEEVIGDERDLVEARKLLDASGLPEEEWTPRVQPIGASISEENLFHEAAVAEVGIKLDWAPPELGSYATRVFMGLGGDGSAGGFHSTWSMRLDPDGNIGDFYVQDGSYNSGQAPMPQLEPLVVKARETLDVDERKAIYVEIQQFATEHVLNTITQTYRIASHFGSERLGNLDKINGGEGKERFYMLYNTEANA